jgi:hypothetical protein
MSVSSRSKRSAQMCAPLAASSPYLISLAFAAEAEPTLRDSSTFRAISLRCVCQLRRLLVLGATASLRWLHKRMDPLAAWTKRLLQRRPARLVTVALANKMARIAWAIMTTGELFRSDAPIAAA